MSAVKVNSTLFYALFVVVVTHSRLLVCHEDSITGQVVAGTGSVCVVGVQQAAALRRPPAAPRYT